ncbi:hypothetical protein GALMADRAFT_1345053 [Galerina marginata CBS 339.88]|uniref:Uncharacterized protein n=1 Tax=Galerina marginata (strain CBS 339.88) TaxID=685588 RepID=A0A067SN14_GALM3|nr:hypothetical protein GALMADRAFT_1345053 [Galerina marginata CBS 339.88]
MIDDQSLHRAMCNVHRVSKDLLPTLRLGAHAQQPRPPVDVNIHAVNNHQTLPPQSTHNPLLSSRRTAPYMRTTHHPPHPRPAPRLITPFTSTITPVVKLPRGPVQRVRASEDADAVGVPCMPSAGCWSRCEAGGERGTVCEEWV